MPSKPRARIAGCGVAAFTLVETVMAMALCVGSLSVFYLSAAQAVRIIRSAKEEASASQLLDQRFEAFRARALWSDVITVSGLKAMATPGLPAAAPLANLSETYTVSTYPGDVFAFSVTRNADGTLSTSGTSLPSSQKSVRITGNISWRATQQVNHNRTLTTVFTQGGT